MIEKKTVINLVEAFAVAVKHYLRGEVRAKIAVKSHTDLFRRTASITSRSSQ